jgi:signal transduction histidine kinase
VDSDTSPQPGLGELDALVDGFRRAGLKATLRIDGPPPALPPGIDLAAYRVIQEALTNALKHADGAAVAVRVRCAEDTLELEVLDDGQNPARAAVNGHGQGLVGMRERLSLYGGELEVGPGRDRGFVVRARFPLAQ